MPGERSLAELRQLVSSLSRDEARYLKLLLHDVHLDIITDLPIELVCMVALQLKHRDLARCLCVSRAWRGRFLSQVVLMAYARHHWPAIVTKTTTGSDVQRFLSRLGFAQRRYGWWDHTTQTRIQPTSVLVRIDWGSHAVMELDTSVHRDLRLVPLPAQTEYTDVCIRHPLLYAFGKVAFCIDSRYRVVVDNVRARERITFQVPEGWAYGPRVKLEALGSRLVVATIERLLVAWDHVDNSFRKKLMPSRSLRCATGDNTVAVILSDGPVLIWTFGKAILELNTSRLKLELGIKTPDTTTWDSCLDAYFDPRDSKTLFLVSGYTPRISGNAAVRFTVHEFADGNHVASWVSERLDMEVRPHEVGRPFEPRIATYEYECEQGQIFFVRPCKDKKESPLAAFCKVKREFIYFQGNSSSTWVEISMSYALPQIIHAFPFLPPKKESGGAGCDLDFWVTGWDGPCYFVRQGSKHLTT